MQSFERFRLQNARLALFAAKMRGYELSPINHRAVHCSCGTDDRGIVSAGAGFNRMMDGQHQCVLPGLIDGHVHLTDAVAPWANSHL